MRKWIGRSIAPLLEHVEQHPQVFRGAVGDFDPLVTKKRHKLRGVAPAFLGHDVQGMPQQQRDKNLLDRSVEDDGRGKRYPPAGRRVLVYGRFERAVTRLATLRCSIITPLGVPVEPEV